MSSECSRGLCRKQQKDKKTASVLICTQCYTRHSHLSSDTLATHTHCQQWAQLGLVCLCVSKHPVNPGQGHCGITEPICGTESGDICPFDTHKWCVCVCVHLCVAHSCVHSQLSHPSAPLHRNTMMLHTFPVSVTCQLLSHGFWDELQLHICMCEWNTVVICSA